MAWAQEMRAWFALTRGDYRGVLAAATGHDVAPSGAAAVQLHAQKAKAWARIGDRRQVEVALDQGRSLLEQMPYPDNLDNHFAVDPAKWDFYSMDCYRLLGAGHDAASTENKLAESYATEVIRIGTGAAGTELSPMRNAEARVTLGVIAARQGELERALDHGHRALSGDRALGTEPAHGLQRTGLRHPGTLRNRRGRRRLPRPAQAFARHGCLSGSCAAGEGPRAMLTTTATAAPYRACVRVLIVAGIDIDHLDA